MIHRTATQVLLAAAVVLLAARPASGACTYSISPPTISAPAAGTSATVNITTQTGCYWMASIGVLWITVGAGQQPFGTGNGQVTFVIAVNTSSSQRTGTVDIGGQKLTVTQAGAATSCTYSISAPTASIAAGGGNGSVTVTAGSGCTWYAQSNASWITLNLNPSGSGNGTLTYSVAANTSTSQRQGTVTIAGQTFTVSQAAAAATGPAPTLGGVGNAADGAASFAPGMIISVYGSNFATAVNVVGTIPLPNSLAGASVEVVDGSRILNAPLFFVSQLQINAQLPFNMTSSSVQVRVRNAQGVSNAQTITITPRSPRLFTQTMDGKGDAVVLHADFTVVNANSPGAPGETLVLFLTGLGAVSPSVAAGQGGGDGSTGNPLNLVTDPVTVTVNGKPATVSFQGLAPYFVGLYQVNFQVPADAASAQLPITVAVGTQTSQTQVGFMCGYPGVLATGSISPSGGTVSGGGVQITVPPGAFSSTAVLTVSRDSSQPATDAATGRVTPVYLLQGLPAVTSGPITISLTAAAAPPTPDNSYIIIEEAVEAGRFDLLRATVQGTGFTAALPAIAPLGAGAGAGETKSPSARPPQDSPDVQKAFKLFGVKTLYSYTLGDFEFSGTTQPSEQSKADSLQWLNTAVACVAASGLDWSRVSKPVRISVGTGTYAPGEVFGHHGYSSDSKHQPGIVINLGWNIQNNTVPNAILAHLLTHLVLDTYHPLPPYALSADARRPWLWMDEAVATYVENRDPSAPVLASDGNRWELLTVGLNPPSAYSYDQIRTHGYYASPFIDSLLKSGHYPNLTPLYARRANSPATAVIPPIDALKAEDPSLANDWIQFCRTMFDKDPQGVYDWAAAHSDSLIDTGGNIETYDVSLPDLSAVPFRIVNNRKLPDSARFVVNAGGDGPMAAIVYKYQAVPNSTPWVVYMGTGLPSVEIQAGLVPQGVSLLVLMVNARAQAPYTGTSPTELTVAVQGATATPAIGVSPASLTFTAAGSNPANQSLTISNTGAAGSTLTWSATVQTGDPWLTLSGTPSGTNAGTVSVGVNIAGLAAGNYTGTIRISAAGASNTPVDVAVKLTVSAVPSALAYLKTYRVGIEQAVFTCNAVSLYCMSSGNIFGSWSANPFDPNKFVSLQWSGYSFSLDTTYTDSDHPGYSYHMVLSGSVSSDVKTLGETHITSTETDRYNDTLTTEITIDQVPLTTDSDGWVTGLAPLAAFKANPGKYVLKAVFTHTFANGGSPVVSQLDLAKTAAAQTSYPIYVYIKPF